MVNNSDFVDGDEHRRLPLFSSSIIKHHFMVYNVLSCGQIEVHLR